MKGSEKGGEAHQRRIHLRLLGIALVSRFVGDRVGRDSPSRMVFGCFRPACRLRCHVPCACSPPPTPSQLTSTFDKFKLEARFYPNHPGSARGARLGPLCGAREPPGSAGSEMEGRQTRVGAGRSWRLLVVGE